MRTCALSTPLVLISSIRAKKSSGNSEDEMDVDDEVGDQPGEQDDVEMEDGEGEAVKPKRKKKPRKSPAPRYEVRFQHWK